MKSMKFATGGDEAKIAALGGALADSVLGVKRLPLLMARLMTPP